MVDLSKTGQLMDFVFSFQKPADPLVGNIANQYLQHRDEHDKMAKLWVRVD